MNDCAGFIADYTDWQAKRGLRQWRPEWLIVARGDRYPMLKHMQQISQTVHSAHARAQSFSLIFRGLLSKIFRMPAVASGNLFH